MNAKDPKSVLDITRAPRGELAAAQLVEAVAQIGDLAERHYLELKGPSDLDSKANKQKVAKFILGAANRLTEKAAEAFEGCAVMILGVTAKGVEGLPPIEMLELSKVVQPFLGVPGPRWDVFRVPVENSDKQVLVIVVEPPQPGQPVYICRDSGEGLTDGRVYMRADGETREATSAEQDAIRDRAVTSAAAPVELEVFVAGKVVPIVVDEEQTLEEYVATTRRRLFAALPVPEPEPVPEPLPETRGISLDRSSRDADALRGLGVSSVLAEYAKLGSTMSDVAKGVAFQSSLLSTVPEKRTEDEYRDAIDEWEAKLRAAWPDAIVKLAGYAMDASEIAVENKAQTFLHDVEVKVHLEGAVTSVEYYELPDRMSEIHLDLPHPPRKWGPVQRDIGGYIPMPNVYQSNFNPSSFRPSSSTWKNSGSVDVEVDVGDLRPEATFVTDDEETVLVIFGEAPESVEGRWRATTRGYNEVFKGKLTVELTEPRDLTRPLRHLLGLESPTDDVDNDEE